MSRPRTPGLSTMWCDEDPVWNRAVDVLRARDPHRTLPLPVWLWRFWRESRGRQAIVLRGTVTLRDGYRDLLGAVLLRRMCLLRKAFGDRPRIVVSDATIEPTSRALEARLGPFAAVLPWLARLLVRAADGPDVRWCVLSTPERQRFAQTWGVPASRVVVTPFRHTLWEAGAGALPSIGDPHDPVRVFAGGNSLRDYGLLLDAFTDLRGARLLVATDRLAPRDDGRVVVAQLTETRYRAELERCDVLVVPLADSSRSAGQQTYLNGMALGKVVVVADPLGAAHDCVDNGTTGVVVPADVEALRAALTDVLATDPGRRAHHLAMRRRARDAALGFFSPEAYRRRLLDVAGLDVREPVRA
ncbi:glycosyltransferase [Spongisporangium articulatum]|uniref:Glycosyltransferase n=1 Tax=Spongisporangium articulatum TaxID=3362603 RepID=A0ABW8AT77_9ACTN